MRARTYRTLLELGGGLGLLVAIFAAAEVVYPGLSAVCSVNALISCTTVLNSGRTTTLGLPDWAWGVGGFLAILILMVVADRNRNQVAWTYGLLGVTSLGVVLSAYFLYVEVFEIGALCPVCITAYLFGALAWVGAAGLTRRRRARLGAQGAGGRQPGDDSPS